MSTFPYSLLLVPLLGACTIQKDLLATGAPDSTDDGAASEPAVTTGEMTATDDPTATGDPTGAIDPMNTTGAELDTSTGDSFATTHDTEVDTEGCDTACLDEPSPCVEALAWDDGLIGMTARRVTNCAECGLHETLETLLVRIDVGSNVMTVFAEAGIRSDGNAMVIAGDGAIFVGGHRSAIVEGDVEWQQLHKFSPEGALLWTLEPGGSTISDLALRGDELFIAGRFGELAGRAVTDGALLWDIPQELGVSLTGIEVDGDGAFYVVGDTDFGPDQNPLHTMFIRKYAADHTLLWEDVHTPPLPTDYISAEGLALDEAGGVVIATREYVLGPGLDVTTFRKYDAAGALLWAETYPEIGTGDALLQLRARPGGGVIAVGRGGSEGGGLGGFTVALGPDGDVSWSDRKAGPQLKDQRNNDVVAVDDTLLVTGCAYHEVTVEQSSWLLELTP
ncbi:MAG TPA: hypothetical protein VGB85_13935 [Nannocystis sp.]